MGIVIQESSTSPLSFVGKKKNSIKAIRGENGEWIVKLSEIREFVVGKFQHRFTEEVIEFPEDLENLISSIISEEQNSSLNQIPTPQEIKKVFF
jgi:hypothetical protein